MEYKIEDIEIENNNGIIMAKQIIRFPCNNITVTYYHNLDMKDSTDFLGISDNRYVGFTAYHYFTHIEELYDFVGWIIKGENKNYTATYNTSYFSKDYVVEFRKQFSHIMEIILTSSIYYIGI